MIRLVFERLGLRSEIDGDDVVVPGDQRLAVKRDVGEHKAKIQDGPWPAFPADLTSIAVALATQSEGSVLIHEWMFENRLIFTDKLVLMGADITLCDPHRAIVEGPRAPARGEARLARHPRRHGHADRGAVRDGRSEIGNVRQIDRGYERIDERLRDLGARIERVATEPVQPTRLARLAPARSDSRLRQSAVRAAQIPVSLCDRGERDRCQSASAQDRSPGHVNHPIPSGTRDVLPDEMRELRAISERVRAVFERRRLRRGLHAGARVRVRVAARRPRAARGPRTACSTSTATCSCCAPT